MTDEVRKRLKCLAIAATPGPWTRCEGHYSSFEEIKGLSFNLSVCVAATNISDEMYRARMADLDYIAAVDPTTVLALLARIEEFKTQEHHTLNVCGGVIEDLMRVSVSIGLSDEYTDADKIIAEIEKLKANVATARDDALEEAAEFVELKIGRYTGQVLVGQIRALKSPKEET